MSLCVLNVCGLPLTFKIYCVSVCVLHAENFNGENSFIPSPAFIQIKQKTYFLLKKKCIIKYYNYLST